MKKTKDMDVGGQDKATQWILRSIFLLAIVVLIYDVVIGNNHIQFYWENKSTCSQFKKTLEDEGLREMRELFSQIPKPSP